LSKFNYKGSIRARLTGIIFFVVSLTGVVGYGAFVSWYMSNQYDRVVNLSKTVGLVLSQDFAKLVLLNQIDVASDITAKLKSFDRLRSLVLYRANDGVAVYQYSQDGKSFTPLALPKPQDRATKIIHDTATLYLQAIYQEHYFGDVVFEFRVDTVLDVIKKDMNILIFIGLSIFIYSLTLFCQEIY